MVSILRTSIGRAVEDHVAGRVPSEEMLMLEPYQVEGVKFLRKHDGGCLWDDPGLGKTRQAIVAAAHRTPVLVVCPSTLRAWWEEEIKTIYPEATVYVAEAGGRIGGADINKLPTREWTVVHYTGLRCALDAYRWVIWGAVICDEAHYIKNAKAQRTKAVKLTTPVDAMRIALTATPFSTLVADLWAQLAWVSHEFKMDYLGYWPFYDEFVQYTKVRSRTTGKVYRKPEGIRDEKKLATLMSRYGLHRSNERVMPTQDMPLLLEGRQATLYRALKKRVEVAIRDSLTGEITGVLIRNALARLLYLERCLSCPWTLDSGVTGVKLTWVKEWAEGYPKPAVIVSRFKASANRIAEVLGTTAVTGDVKNSARNEIISSWQAGKQQFLVGTIHTLGTGLNLDRGWAMVFYDSVWSPISMAQARDRINRMTTDHPIQALYLYVKGTTSELVLRSWQNAWDQRRLVMEFLEHLKEV